MKQIPLTQNQFAIVDDRDFEWLNQWKWYALWYSNTKSFYAVRSKTESNKHHTISMAREVLGLKYGDKRQGDHIDHDTLDNRILNLRIVTRQQNQWNHRNLKGYTWDKHAKKFRARIGLNGKQINLGLFCAAEEAHNIYLRAKKIYHNF